MRAERSDAPIGGATYKLADMGPRSLKRSLQRPFLCILRVLESSYRSSLDYLARHDQTDYSSGQSARGP
jgi:hypothetical protein